MATLDQQQENTEVPTTSPRDKQTENHAGRRASAAWVIGVTAVIFALSLAIWFWWDEISQLIALLQDQEAVSAYIQSFGLWGPLVLAFAQMIQVLFAFIPGHMFLVAAGYVYGFPVGLLMNISFTVAASQLCFLLARWLGRPIVNRFVDPRVVNHWEKVANEKGIVFFTIAFVLPVFPSDAMNFVAGLSGISARRFLVANFLGRLPSAIMLTLIGSHGLELSTGAWTALVIVAVGLFIGGRLVVHKLQIGMPKQQMASMPTD